MVQRYGPGEEAKEFAPGDFILAHRHNLIAGLISQAQKRRFKGADSVYAHWSHSAMIVEQDGALVASLKFVMPGDDKGKRGSCTDPLASAR